MNAFTLLPALYNGDIRVTTIDVLVDGALVTIWTSSGTTDSFETIALPDSTAGTVIELQGVLGDSEWLSIIEVSFCLSTPLLTRVCFYGYSSCLASCA